MNQEKWMDLSINQIIRSKHVKCNMKVDLLKDFFNSSDKVAKNKQYRQRKLNSSILSSSSVNQKLSLTSQNQSIIKQGSGSQQQQPNINNMKRNKSNNNNNLWQDVKNSFDSSKKNNSSNNLQQLENSTQEANSEVKKQETEIDNFLESEAMFYDHIFRDINSIFIDLFYQKFNLIQDKVIQNKNNSQQENRNDRSILIDKKISLSSQDDENRNSNFRSNSVNENKLQNSQILRQLTVQQKQQINQSKQLRKSLEDKRKTLKQIQISKIIEIQNDNYYECNQNSFRQDYLSGYNFDNNQGYLQNLEHSEQYNQFVQSLLQTNKNKQKLQVKKELKLWQQMCLDVTMLIKIIEEFLIISYTTYTKYQKKQKKQMLKQYKENQEIQIQYQNSNQSTQSNSNNNNFSLFFKEDEHTLNAQFFEQNSHLNSQILKSFSLRNRKILKEIVESIQEDNLQIVDSISKVYRKLKRIKPSALGIDKELCLLNQQKPYSSCVVIIKNMNKSLNPIKILELCVQLKEEICNQIYNYKMQQGEEQFNFNIDGDQLIMLFCYVLIKARIPRIFSVLEMVEELTEKQQMDSGEEIYCFSMLKSAQSYLISLSKNKDQLKKIQDHQEEFIQLDKQEIQDLFRQSLVVEEENNLEEDE